MIIEPNDEMTAEQAAEAALWETFRRRLELQDSSEGVFYLQHVVRAEATESMERGRYSSVRFDLFQRTSDYSSTYNAVTGERFSWLFDLLRQESEPGADEAACLSAAREVAQPPEDATLATAQFESQGGDTVFVARWDHLHDGVPVENDYIQVLVNPKTTRPFAHHRKWHDVDPTPGER